jgi:hypothetical protein
MHTGGREFDVGPPWQIFEKLVNKNTIKQKMVYPFKIFPQKACPRPPLGILAKIEATFQVFNSVYLISKCLY